MTGRGGYKTGAGGAVKFYPYKIVLAMLKGGGGTKRFGPAIFPFSKFWGSFYTVA